ncbi:hypothetical protein [Streptomyces sp. NPDC048551]|uniref:hypothetical protein n=1 Tax=Streptomyces sp. NPDC048551 TaxID=3155758 RepID=UPI003434F245
MTTSPPRTGPRPPQHAGTARPEPVARGVSSTADTPGPPPVSGFAFSPFGPLVAEAATRCLNSAPGGPGTVAGSGTAIVLVTTFGDTVTADAVTTALAEGRTPSPVLFFQSVPTSVLGHITRVFKITGPMVCLSELPGAEGHAEAAACLLLASGTTERVLLIEVELAAGRRDSPVRTHLQPSAPVPRSDRATATLFHREAPSQ